MDQAMAMAAMGGFGLAALGLVSWAMLKAWHGWLELKRLELTNGPTRIATEGGMAERIEMADLKERIRKLESLAACIDI